MIANVKLFFPVKMVVFLEHEKKNQICHEFHIITLETAFAVRPFLFVVFGLSIVITSLFNFNTALINLLIIASIYAIRFVILKVFRVKDILPQLFVAPRRLITVLLFYAIPEEAQVANFESGILLFVIIATSLIMPWANIKDKKKNECALI
ncbi:MAG: cell volume regulation protein A [Maribacter sp.]